MERNFHFNYYYQTLSIRVYRKAHAWLYYNANVIIGHFWYFKCFFYISVPKIRGWKFAKKTKNNWTCLYVLPGLRKHDVCFLITVRPTKPYGTKFDRRRPFIEQVGLVYVRGCEIQGMLDDKGRVIEDGMGICVFESVCT